MASVNSRSLSLVLEKHMAETMQRNLTFFNPQRSIDPVICTSCCILVKQLVGGHVDVSKKLGWEELRDLMTGERSFKWISDSFCLTS